MNKKQPSSLSKKDPSSIESNKRKKIHPSEEKKEKTKTIKKKVSIPIEEEKETKTSKKLIKKQMFGFDRVVQRKKTEGFELGKEKSFGNFCFDSTLPLLLIPNVTIIQPYEPTIRLEIIQSKIPFNQITTNYIISSRGVVGSLRKPENTFIKEAIIGKAMLDNNMNICNDIMLNQNDFLISRKHCTLIYTHWFKKKVISPDFLCFLMYNNRRENYLPKTALWLIKQFIYEPKKLMMSDMGSLHGTYVRLQEGKSIEMKKCMSFLIAPDVTIEVENVFNEMTDFLFTYRNRGILRKSFMEPEEHSDIYSTFIHGAFQYFKCNLDTNNVGLVFSCSKSPCLQLKLVRSVNESPVEILQYLIIKNNKEIENFAINFGPANTNTIKILRSYVSFEISYDEKNKRWLMQDVSMKMLLGAELRRNAEFGLWNCLSDVKSGLRYIPKVREVVNRDEIKVSETIFKIIC